MRPLLLMLPFVVVSPVRGQQLPHLVPSAGVAQPSVPVAGTPFRPAAPTGSHIPREEEDASGAIMGALIFGGIGLGLASLTCNLDALLYGEAIGLGLGAHLGNRRRGNVLAPLLTSVGVMAAARVLAREFGATREWVLVVPMLQITGAASRCMA